MQDLTIRGAELVLPDRVITGDLAIEGGKITQIGVVSQPVGRVIEGAGLTVLPGVIDPQVHFREPGFPRKEDIGSGSRAAAAGGMTSFLEMPNTWPPTTDQAALDHKLQRGALTSSTNYGFFFGATEDNVEVAARVRGACGLKIFMGSSTGTLLVDRQAALEAHFANFPGVIAVHAEDETRLKARKARFAGETDPAMHPVIRDAECALIATRRAVDLSARHGRRLHVLHLSTAEEVEFLRSVRHTGLVTTETLPQYLWLDASMYEALGTHLQMNPPVRAKAHGEALWAGLLDGTIDCIATDHAPHTLEEKAQPFGKAPSGMPGVELALPLMLHAVASGRCSIRHVARWMAEGPARCYGIQGKGRLEVGFDGDLAIVDRHLERRVDASAMHTRVGWTPFEGWTLKGWPRLTILGGQVVYEDGELNAEVRGAPLRFSPSATVPIAPKIEGGA